MKQRMPLTPAFLVTSILFHVAIAATAAGIAWPIYRDWHFPVLVVAATALATAIVLLTRRLSWITVAGITLGVYLLVGVPLAVPSALATVSGIPRGFVSLVTGTVWSWKELATITTIPVGGYQTLLVPALIVFLVGGVLSLSFALRTRRAWAFVVPVAVGMFTFGIVFGSATVSGGGALAPRGGREILLGVIGFLLCLGYLVWRVQYDRRVAVRAAQSTAGIRQSREATVSLLRRSGIGAATLVVAILIGVVVAPAVGGETPRQVLRSQLVPENNVALTESPLAGYRGYFSDAEYDADLFTVRIDGLEGARLRLSVLSHYDGQQYRAVDPATGGTAASAFVRVPYRLSPARSGPEGTASITVDGYDESWVPTASDLLEVTFTGTDAQSNADGFFYNQSVEAGLETEPLQEGDSFTVTAVRPASAGDGASIEKPTTASGMVDPALVPDSLKDWVRAQQDTSLPALLGHLRARGYLSHAIFAPDAAAAPVNWVSELGGGYSFAESRAGHSVSRIDTLFTQLNEKQQQTPDATEDAQLVSGVGDDEQFAVAGALLAQYLGYPARVVLGFALDGSERGADDIPACSDVCKGKNLTAWIEVQGADGAWQQFDTTPQHSTPLNRIQENQQPPKNGTDVLPDAASREQAIANDPTGGEDTSEPDEEETVDLTWLVTTLKIVGLSLLALAVLLAPFATILFAKWRRRRQRRAAKRSEDRIVGGWDEYVDVALDHGRPVPTSQTRSQVAATFGTPQAGTLATLADTAVFAPFEPVDDEANRFWEILEAERLEFTRGMSWWQRWRAALSLRSFSRYLSSGSRPASESTRTGIMKLRARRSEGGGASGSTDANS